MRLSLEVMQRREQEFQQATNRAEVDRLLAKWQREDDATARAKSSEARELAELRRRLGRLEKRLAPGGDILNGMLEGLGQVLADARGEFRGQIEVLERRVAELETTKLKFSGVHEVGRQYSPGALVIRNGGLWHCNAETRTTPGAGGDWVLCTKSGEVR